MRSGPYEPDKRWVGHVVHMEDGRIPNGKLAEGKRPTARRQLRYKDVCKRDLEAMENRPHHVGSCSLRLDGLEADCALRKAYPPLNSHSHNRLRQRKRGERPEAKLTYRKRISLASSAAGIATPASDFPVIPDPDPASVSPPRAQLHSLPRLMDAKD